MATRNIFARMTLQGAFAAQMQAVNASMVKTKQSSSQLNSEVSKLNNGMNTLGTSAAGAAVGFYAMTAATAEFVAGLRYVEDFNQSIITMTGFVSTFSKAGQEGDFARAFKEANEYAKELIPKLEIMDAQTVATGRDLTLMAETMAQYGVWLDLANKKQEEGFINIANALAMMTAGQQKEIQMRQEIHALLAGQMRMTDRLPKILASIHAQNKDTTLSLKDQLKVWQEQGVTIEKVGDMLSGFGLVVPQIEKTWAAVGTTMNTIHRRILREGMLPAYEDLMNIAIGVNDSLKEADGSLTPLAEQIVTMMHNAWEETKGWATALDKITPDFETILDLVEKIGSGVSGIGKVTIAYGGLVLLQKAIAGVGAATLTANVAMTRYVATAALGEALFDVGLLSRMELFKIQVLGVSASATTAEVALAGLQATASGLFAGYAGWQLGTYLEENFEIARQAGVAFTDVTLRGVHAMEDGFKRLGLAVQAVSKWRDGASTESVSGWYQVELDHINRMTKAWKVDHDALIDDILNPNSKNSSTSKKASSTPESQFINSEEMLKEYSKALTEFDKFSEKYKKSYGNFSNAVFGSQEKTLAHELEAVNRTWTDKQNDLLKALDEKWAAYANVHKNEIIANAKDAYEAEMKLVNARHGAEINALEARGLSEKDLARETKLLGEKQARESANIEEQWLLEQVQNDKQYQEAKTDIERLTLATITMLRQQVRDDDADKNAKALAKEAKERTRVEQEFSDKYSQVTLAAMNKKERAVESLRRSYADLDVAVWDLFDAEKLSAEEAEKLQKMLGEQFNKDLFDADDQLLRDKMDLYKDLAGFEDEYRQVQLDWVERIRLKEIDATGDIEAANKKAAKSIATINQAAFEAKTNQVDTALGQMQSAFQSIGSMYDKNSSEYARMQDASEAMIVLQQGVAVANAVAAIANQGMGDPYTAFARMAAMAAAVGGLLASAGISFGSAGGMAGENYTASNTNTTGTVLGDSSAASESSQNILDLLTDIHADEYSELQGIYSEVKQLNQNISGLVDNVVRNFGEFTPESFGVQNTSVKGFLGNAGDSINDTINSNIDSSFGDLNGIVRFLNGVTITTNKFIGWLGDGLFGGGIETSLAGAGLEVGAMIIRDLQNGVEASVKSWSRTRFEEDGGWFGSDHTWDELNYQAVDASSTQLFTKIFDNMGNLLLELGEGFNADLGPILSHAFNLGMIDLQNMDTTEISATLSAAISAAGDLAAEQIFGDIIGIYQSVNEGLLETATRLYSEQEAAFAALRLTNQSLIVGDAVGAGVRATQELLLLSNGIEAFVDSTSGYYDKFITEEEKLKDLTTSLLSQFSKVNDETGFNLVVPETRNAFISLVEGLDLTTESGKKAYVALLGMSEGADEWYSTVEDRQKDLEELLAGANETISSAINTYILTDLEVELNSLTLYFNNLAEALNLTGQYAANAAIFEQTRAAAIRDAIISSKQAGLSDANGVLSTATANLKASFAAAKIEEENTLTASRNKLLEDHNTLLTDYQDNLTTINDTIRDLGGYVDSIRSSRSSMDLGTDAFARDQFAAASTILDSVLQQTRANNFSGLGALNDVLDTVSQPDANLYATFADYQRDYNKTYLALGEIDALTSDQLSLQESTALTMENLLASENEMFDAQQDQFDIQTSQLDAQLNALLGINVGVLSLSDAILAYNNAQNGVDVISTQIDRLKNSTYYSSEQIRAYVQTAGLNINDPWAMDQAIRQNNANPYDVGAAFGLIPQEVDEYFRRSNVPGFASGGFHSGGYRVVGENGPELEYTGASTIFSNQQSKTLLDTSEIVNTLKDLITTVSDQGRQLRAIQTNTFKAADTLDTFELDGIAIQA